MPKLLLFAPCEKVIIAQYGNTASLITILQELTVSVPPDVQIPADAKVPVQWYGFSLWQKQPGDEGKRYEQQIEFADPDGGIVVSASYQFGDDGPFAPYSIDFFRFPCRAIRRVYAETLPPRGKRKRRKKRGGKFSLNCKEVDCGVRLF